MGTFFFLIVIEDHEGLGEKSPKTFDVSVEGAQWISQKDLLG